MSERIPIINDRRQFLVRAARITGAAWVASLLPAAARATPAAMQDAIRRIVGDAELREGRVTLAIEPLVENGNTVPMSVAADRPMSDADRVKAIHVVNEKNPQPHVISIAFGSRAGRASFSTRIKLADSQRIVAIAEMNDGSFWSGSAEVVVTLAACVEDLVK